MLSVQFESCYFYVKSKKRGLHTPIAFKVFRRTNIFLITPYTRIIMFQTINIKKSFSQKRTSVSSRSKVTQL